MVSSVLIGLFEDVWTFKIASFLSDGIGQRPVIKSWLSLQKELPKKNPSDLFLAVEVSWSCTFLTIALIKPFCKIVSYCQVCQWLTSGIYNKLFARHLMDPGWFVEKWHGARLEEFLLESQNVTRKVWMTLPMDTRYHTPAADLYRPSLEDRDNCLTLVSQSHELKELGATLDVNSSPCRSYTRSCSVGYYGATRCGPNEVPKSRC